MTDERLDIPEPCASCSNPSNDWMVRSKIVSATKSICGPCKIELAQQISSRMLTNFITHISPAVWRPRKARSPSTHQEARNWLRRARARGRVPEVSPLARGSILRGFWPPGDQGGQGSQGDQG